MQLFGYKASPFVRHVRIALMQTQALRQTQNAAEFIEIDGDYSAKHSPSMKVPFLKDGNLTLTDSTSILRYIREHAGQKFLPNIQSLDTYCLINTLLDSTINIFLLERDGLDPKSEAYQNIAYLKRQHARIKNGLEHLNSLKLNEQTLDIDVQLRLDCFLAWGLFPKRFTLDNLPHLQAQLDATHHDELFTLTQP